MKMKILENTNFRLLIIVLVVLLMSLYLVLLKYLNLEYNYIVSNKQYEPMMDGKIDVSGEKLSSTTSDKEEFSKIERLKSYDPVYQPGRYMADENYIRNDIFKEDLSVDIHPTAKNVTPSNTTLIIYNMVPKCGSSTLQEIFKGLSGKNHFHYEDSSNINDQWVKHDEQISMLENVYKTPDHEMTLFSRYMYYFNVTRLGFAEAGWMNMVREPVSRFISQYYFLRKRSVWEDVPLFKKSGPPPDWWFEMTLDDCMKAQRPECLPQPRNEIFLQLSYFCGHHPECRKLGSKWALQRAKRHAEKYFSVIGVLEEFSLSLDVFEGYLPRMFNDIKSLDLSSGNVTMNKGTDKPPVSSGTMEIIKEFLKEDIQFYEFLQDRLHLQAKALGLK